MPRRMRRRQYRRKPAYRRRMKKTNRAIARNVHYFKRKVVLGNITSICGPTGVTTPAASGFSFKLSDLPGSTEFTTLFDQYAITGVKLDFIPMADNISWQVANNGTGVSAPGGPLLISPDYDDTAAPASANVMLERQNTKVVPVGRRHRMYIKPSYNLESFAPTTAFSPRRGWIDTEFANVPHYGVKVWMAAPNINDTSFTYQLWATYYIKCKGVQ